MFFHAADEVSSRSFEGPASPTRGGRRSPFSPLLLQCQLCRLTRLSKALIAALGSAPRSLLPVGLELLKRRLSAVALKGMG